MLERLEHPMLVCEWDEETGEGSVAVGVPGPAAEARELAWAVVSQLHDVLSRAGLEWDDEEWRERHDLRCVPWASDGRVEVALLWRSRFKRESDVRALSAAVKHGLGVPAPLPLPSAMPVREQRGDGSWPERPPGPGAVRWAARWGHSDLPEDGRDGDVVVFP